VSGAPAAIAVAAVAALGLAPAASAERAGAAVRVEHRDPAAPPTRGPAAAPVTIEYFFQPMTSAQTRLAAYRAIERLQRNHPTRIRAVFRVLKRSGQVQLPILALEAHAQGKFFDLMEELHVSPSRTGPLSRADVLELARKIGVDTARLGAALASERYSDVLDANDRRHERLLRGASSVPAVVLNTRPPRLPLATSAVANDAEWEREYAAAYERAMDLVDRGVAPRDLPAALDALALRAAPPVIAAGPDDGAGSADDPRGHPLASPPLELTGLPWAGAADATAAVVVVLLCRPNDSSCGRTAVGLRRLPEAYGRAVRLVWAPWFEVDRDEASELALLGDAALCAEQLGSSPDLGASAGWRWIERQLQGPARPLRGRAPPDRWAERRIDEVATQVDIDPQQLAACRSRRAGATIAWIERARRAGVRQSPAVVVGGRIYPRVQDVALIQQLIEAELAPGILGELAPALARDATGPAPRASGSR
jgi:hypothetical protein